MEFLKEITSAVKTVLHESYYVNMLIAVTVIFALAYIFIPVYAIPGNSLEFWLRIIPWWAYALIIIFSFAISLLFTMNFYIFKYPSSVIDKTKGISSIVATILAGLYSTAVCIACVGSLFAFIGAGAILFLADHQNELILLSLFTTTGAIYFTSKKVNYNCEFCKIPKTRKAKH